MGIPVMIMGESGVGKSASLRNFEYGEVGVFNVAKKMLPFRGKLMVNNKSSYADIARGLSNPHLNCFVIDDSQYLMAFEFFNRAKDKGYDKFTDIAVSFYRLLQYIIDDTPDDTIVYLLHHTDTADDGRIKAKTMGKMLDQKLAIEGLLSIVILARTDGQDHWFETQSDGMTTCKSPMGMLPARMENDLKQVDDAIREYARLAPRKLWIKETKQEMKQEAKQESQQDNQENNQQNNQQKDKEQAA